MLVDFTELRTYPPGEGLEALVAELGRQAGFRVDSSGRGPDGGVDLIFIETLQGIISNQPMKWIVQCKDRAVSGRALTREDISGIIETLSARGAHGFIIVTTTVAGSQLSNELRGIEERMGYQVRVWDRGYLERRIIADPLLFRQFFPTSYRKAQTAEDSGYIISLLPASVPTEVQVLIHRTLTNHTVRSKFLAAGKEIMPRGILTALSSAFFLDDDAAAAADILSLYEAGPGIAALSHLKTTVSHDMFMRLVLAIMKSGGPLADAIPKHFSPRDDKEGHLWCQLIDDAQVAFCIRNLVYDFLNSSDDYLYDEEIDKSGDELFGETILKMCGADVGWASLYSYEDLHIVHRNPDGLVFTILAKGRMDQSVQGPGFEFETNLELELTVNGIRLTKVIDAYQPHHYAF